MGKTTTAINLAAALAAAELRVLVIDLDPQSNLTSGVGQKGRTGAGGSVYHALTAQTGAPDLTPFVISTPVSRLMLIPSDRQLTGAEILRHAVGLEGSHRLVNLQISTTATWRTAELRAALRVQIRAPAKVRTLA